MDEAELERRLKAIGYDPPAEPAPETDAVDTEAGSAELADAKRTVQVFKTMARTEKLLMLSDARLDEALDWHLEEGVAYHMITAGDVDALSLLKHVAHEQRIDYALISTWVISPHSADVLADWVERGILGRADFYVGEVFKDGYRGSRAKLDAICAACGGRVARFRNHSKVTAFFGRRYSGVIESSANYNINPRHEHACITVDRSLAEFYKGYFDGINDFDGGYRSWEPWDAGKAGA